MARPARLVLFIRKTKSVLSILKTVWPLSNYALIWFSKYDETLCSTF